MLLVFRQHRLASSATGGASVMLHTRSSSGAFAFLLQAFSFSNKKKMPKRGEYNSLIMVGREGKG